jgi:hypothetical protein
MGIIISLFYPSTSATKSTISPSSRSSSSRDASSRYASCRSLPFIDDYILIGVGDISTIHSSSYLREEFNWVVTKPIVLRDANKGYTVPVGTPILKKDQIKQISSTNVQDPFSSFVLVFQANPSSQLTTASPLRCTLPTYIYTPIKISDEVKAYCTNKYYLEQNKFKDLKECVLSVINKNVGVCPPIQCLLRDSVTIQKDVKGNWIEYKTSTVVQDGYPSGQCSLKQTSSPYRVHPKVDQYCSSVKCMPFHNYKTKDECIKDIVNTKQELISTINSKNCTLLK